MTETLSGSLSPGALEDLLEYLRMTRASGRLSLRADKDKGHIDLQAGAVTRSVWGRLTGDQALGRLLELETGSFEFRPEGTPAGGAAIDPAAALLWEDDAPLFLPDALLEGLSLTARRLLGPIGEIFLEDAAEDLGYDDGTAIRARDAQALVSTMAGYMDAEQRPKFLSAAAELLHRHGL